MTIPERPADGSEASPAGGAPRVTRVQPERTRPVRSRPAPSATAQDDAPAGTAEAAPEIPVSESIAHAVRMGYDVIAENIRQGRAAAQRFREGEYNIREVPGDLEVAALRILQLARELSTTTFDVCEKLLKEVAGAAPGKARGDGVPPFPAPASAPEPAPSAAGTGDPPMMRLTVRFEGSGSAHGLTTRLERPREPTAPADIIADALTAADPGLAPITTVHFEVDMAVEGLIAVVSLPPDQPDGVYSGLVRTKGGKVPLGALTIEVGK